LLESDIEECAHVLAIKRLAARGSKARRNER
jgi:hypothetical protein